MASAQLVRIALFKFPKKEDQQAMLENFKELWKTAVKDGKPYILSLEAGPTPDDSNLNFNFVGRSVFRNMEDMLYFEKECPANARLKAKATRELELQGIISVYFMQEFSESL